PLKTRGTTSKSPAGSGRLRCAGRRGKEFDRVRQTNRESAACPRALFGASRCPPAAVQALRLLFGRMLPPLDGRLRLLLLGWRLRLLPLDGQRHLVPLGGL